VLEERALICRTGSLAFSTEPVSAFLVPQASLGKMRLITTPSHLDYKHISTERAIGPLLRKTCSRGESKANSSSAVVFYHTATATTMSSPKAMLSRLPSLQQRMNQTDQKGCSMETAGLSNSEA
jgi:hypothetical protein